MMFGVIMVLMKYDGLMLKKMSCYDCGDSSFIGESLWQFLLRTLT